MRTRSTRVWDLRRIVFDLTNITITLVLSFVFAGHLVGVGVGTILAMIGVGRTIAVFNHFTYERMKEMAGVEE